MGREGGGEREVGREGGIVQLRYYTQYTAYGGLRYCAAEVLHTVHCLRYCAAEVLHTVHCLQYCVAEVLHTVHCLRWPTVLCS